MDRPGNAEIQLDLFLSYGTNVPLYPRVPSLLQEVSAADVNRLGKNDFIFPPPGAAL